MNVRYSNEIPPLSQLLSLYGDAQWHNYTNDHNALLRAFAHSQDVIGAYCEDKLVGLIRSIGDKTTILYIQDIIVAKEYKRKGIGTHLVRSILSVYPEIRQVVLLTDDNPESSNFYESLNFKTANKTGTICFVKLNLSQ